MPECELCGVRHRLSLVSDVLFYDFPVASFGYGGKVVAIAPELTSPEFSAQCRKSLKQLACGDAFEHAHHFGTAVFWME